MLLVYTMPPRVYAEDGSWTLEGSPDLIEECCVELDQRSDGAKPAQAKTGIWMPPTVDATSGDLNWMIMLGFTDGTVRIYNGGDSTINLGVSSARDVNGLDAVFLPRLFFSNAFQVCRVHITW